MIKLTTSEKAIITHNTEQSFISKLKKASWEDMLTVPIFTPIVIMINSMLQQWQQGTLSFESLILGSGLIVGFVIAIMLPIIWLKIYRLDKQDEQAMRQKRFDLEIKRRETDIRTAEVRAASEIEVFKLMTEKRLELFSSMARELDARTTLKTAIGFTLIGQQSKEALNAISSLDTSDNINVKIKALEEQMEEIQLHALEEAETATKNYHETLSGGLPVDVPFKAQEDDCPVPAGAEITLEEAPKFDSAEEVLKKELEKDSDAGSPEWVEDQIKEIRGKRKEEVKKPLP